MMSKFIGYAILILFFYAGYNKYLTYSFDTDPINIYYCTDKNSTDTFSIIVKGNEYIKNVDLNSKYDFEGVYKDNNSQFYELYIAKQFEQGSTVEYLFALQHFEGYKNLITGVIVNGHDNNKKYYYTCLPISKNS